MDKKDIYEHLANIYLDASSKRKKKGKSGYKIKKIFLLNLVILVTLSLVLFISLKNKLPQTSPHKLIAELALVLQPDIVKINFHFDPAKKEIYAIDLNKMDLQRFKTLGFLARKADFDHKITLKIEFANAFKENSQLFISDIKSYKWQEYRLPLANFKDISNWSQITRLSFIIEEQDVKEKKGIVYLDNVRLLR